MFTFAYLSQFITFKFRGLFESKRKFINYCFLMVGCGEGRVKEEEEKNSIANCEGVVRDEWRKFE